MMIKLMLSLALLVMACSGSANSFTADGTVFEPAYGYNFVASRFLVPDGDFEEGSCLDTPTWICTTDNSCDWIADLVPLGLWNFSGAHIAWLGGFCGGLATCTTTICKDIVIDHAGCLLTWFWMAYVNDQIMEFYVKVDGNYVFQFFPQLSDHLLDYQQHSAYVGMYGDGTHNACFGMNDSGCMSNLGDNYFADYVELWCLSSATEDASFSAVKSMY